jgi:chromosome segregation ATPase
LEFENKQKLQETIVALLKHISKGIVMSKQIPGDGGAAGAGAGGGAAEKFDEVKKELSFKEAKLGHAKNTRQILDAELARRKEELARINGLDKKITGELQALKEKMAAQAAEMNGWKSADELQKDADEAKRTLTVTKQKLLKQREAIKQQVAQLSAQQKKRETVRHCPSVACSVSVQPLTQRSSVCGVDIQELSSSEVYRKMEASERTLRAHAQNNFTMTDCNHPAHAPTQRLALCRPVLTRPPFPL